MIKVICDTNVWYDIAANKIRPEDLEGLRLCLTNVTLMELASTPNLVKDWRKIQKVVQAIRSHGAAIYELNPFDFIIQKQFPNHVSIDQSYRSILSSFDNLLAMDEATVISDEVLHQMKASIAQLGAIEQGAADTINKLLPEIRKKIKEESNKHEHRAKKSFPIIYDVINVFIKQYTNNEISLDVDTYPWHELDLLVRAWDNYFKDLEVSPDQKFKPNDWPDILVMTYVAPTDRFSTDDQKWVTVISKDKITKPYLIQLKAE